MTGPTAFTAESDEVLIVGGGIGGLVTALSLHQVGIPVRVFESVNEIRALGVGINLLPHAVRELDALGILERLRASAICPTTLTYFTKHGKQIWTEQRGLDAGYAWPQLSIHRGTLQTELLGVATERLGAHRIVTGAHLLGFSTDAKHAHARFALADRTTPVTVSGQALIACDGIHSAARRQLHPDEGMPRWNGARLWRGICEVDPVLGGRTMVWAGHPEQKFIAYPVRDLPNGKQVLNFIAELREDIETTGSTLSEREDWNKPGTLSDFLPSFASWNFDWLDVPSLLTRAPQTFLFPMVDRDPLDKWSYGRMTLLGDAAHPMYPVGSNGASQAILDARVLAGCLRAHHDDVFSALERYDELRRPPTAKIVLANRGLGPELPMRLVEERAPDGFASIHDVISPEEILEATDGYRTTAGFALAALSNPTAPSLLDTIQ
jgi:5-methylphenazine-1-carboxylate 1-monooxygenase